LFWHTANQKERKGRRDFQSETALLVIMQQLDFVGKTKEELAIEFIRENEPPNGYAVMYSGGKDSDVLTHLAWRSGVSWIPFYSLMPDPPELIKYTTTKFPHLRILRPQYSFWRGIVNKFPPHRKAAWCCTEIKEKPSREIGLTYRLVGIRAEESSNRAKLGWVNQITKQRINLHPLYNWKEWEIWDYIERNGLKYCSLYDEGLSRLGCVVCPKRTNSKAQEFYRKRWPQYFRLFEKQVKKWWKLKGQYRENETAQSAEEFLHNWYQGK